MQGWLRENPTVLLPLRATPVVRRLLLLLSLDPSDCDSSPLSRGNSSNLVVTPPAKSSFSSVMWCGYFWSCCHLSHFSEILLRLFRALDLDLNAELLVRSGQRGAEGGLLPLLTSCPPSLSVNSVAWFTQHWSCVVSVVVQRWRVKEPHPCFSSSLSRHSCVAGWIFMGLCEDWKCLKSSTKTGCTILRQQPLSLPVNFNTRTHLERAVRMSCYSV